MELAMPLQATEKGPYMSHPSIAHPHPYPCSQCGVQRAFCPLPEPLRDVFEGLKTSTVYAKGDFAFHEATPCHAVFILCQGSVKLVTASTGGKVLLLRFAEPGEILGLPEALLSANAPYECSAIAAEPSVMAAIPRETFLRFIASYPSASFRAACALAEQYRFAHREAKFLGFGDTSRARLARLLLQWSDETGEKAQNGIRLPTHVTHTELAESIASTRETVTRILSDLKHRDVLAESDHEIVIRNSDELRRIATEPHQIADHA